MKIWLIFFSIGIESRIHLSFHFTHRDEWFEIPSMSNKREGLTMISDDNVVYAIGGENGFSILNTVEKYDPRVGTWYNCASMGYRRRYFGASVLNNRIYCVGE